MALSCLQHSPDIGVMTDNNDKKIEFSRNIEEIMGSLYRVATRLTNHSSDAEDLVSEAVIKAWTSIDKLEDENRFRPWVFRILHNCFIDSYRKKSSRPDETPYDEDFVEYSKDEVVNFLLNQPDDYLHWWANPERELANKILGERITAAIDSLPEEFRITVILINIEGLSYDETAEVMGVPNGTVRSRMKRGRTLLQKALWIQAKESGLINTDAEYSEEHKL